MAYDGRSLLRALTRGDDDQDASNVPPPLASQQTYGYSANGNPVEFGQPLFVIEE